MVLEVYLLVALHFNRVTARFQLPQVEAQHPNPRLGGVPQVCTTKKIAQLTTRCADLVGCARCVSVRSIVLPKSNAFPFLIFRLPQHVIHKLVIR